jgi:hypothetical protein
MQHESKRIAAVAAKAVTESQHPAQPLPKTTANPITPNPLTKNWLRLAKQRVSIRLAQSCTTMHTRMWSAWRPCLIGLHRPPLQFFLKPPRQNATRIPRISAARPPLALAQPPPKTAANPITPNHLAKIGFVCPRNEFPSALHNPAQPSTTGSPRRDPATSPGAQRAELHSGPSTLAGMRTFNKS